MRRPICLLFLLIIPVSFLLSSCSVYNREYLAVSDYIQDPRQEPSPDEVIKVSDISDLEEAVISIIEENSETDIIVFDSTYTGDPNLDVSSVCRQIIQRNPLCAYCVENITYDVYRVLAYNEAKITVSYAPEAVMVENVRRINFGGEMKSILTSALKKGEKKTAILVRKSTLSSDDIINTCEEIYYSNPLDFPTQPVVSVSVFSDSADSRLYEINVDYGVNDETFMKFKEDVDSFSFLSSDVDGKSSAEKVSMAVSYILSHCSITDSSIENTAYSALVQGEANSKGLSLALVELCNELQVECRIVEGQRNWKNHVWDIVRIDGDYYHIDLERCISEGLAKGFLLNDDSMWNSYRWDLSGYPQCNGPLSYVPGMVQIDEMNNDGAVLD